MMSSQSSEEDPFYPLVPNAQQTAAALEAEEARLVAALQEAEEKRVAAENAEMAAPRGARPAGRRARIAVDEAAHTLCRFRSKLCKVTARNEIVEKTDVPKIFDSDPGCSYSRSVFTIQDRTGALFEAAFLHGFPKAVCRQCHRFGRFTFCPVAGKYGTCEHIICARARGGGGAPPEGTRSRPKNQFAAVAHK